MMQFKVGDYVVHFSYGPGQIVNLEKKQLFGGEARLYYEIMTPKNAVWVPVEPGAKSTLRSVTSKSDLSTYRQILKSKPTTLSKEHRVRHLELTDRLKNGSFQILCEVVRDLTAHGWSKPLSDVDAALLRRVYDNVCQEWSITANITIVEANKYIGALLSEAKQAHKDSS
ncbi:MAG: hypothetical protein HZC38_11420 [Chloroflexi bacterium]|nr:hypothetical protein [Chloroflexota bacterium]MBI5082204.1 hypothetical protein [Chloroflexota bacterium]MBI5348719.1 hypothetical protein [Chloroflexota bacterium]MBI5714012.1 hypothetical protein [Chloroflexota bacterium]